MTRTHLPLAIATMIAALAVACPTMGQGFNPDDVVQAEILPGWRAPDGRHFAALHLTLAPGWKTYWRVPGEAGIPPEFTFAGSDNLATVTVHWPLPKVFEINGLTSIGYAGDLVLPLEIAPQALGTPVVLAMAAQLGICKDICVPLAIDLSADLAASGSDTDPAINAALKSRPTQGVTAGLQGLGCQVAPIADGLQLTAAMTLPSTGGAEVAVVELDGAAVWSSPPVLVRTGDQLSLTSDLVPPEGAPFALNRSALRFTILGSNSTVEFHGCPAG